jgi:acylphosphatase
MSEELDKKEVRGYRVYGRVQGVGFRWWTQRIGTELGLAGHVRNLPGGGVEVHARGSVEELAALEAVLEGGPPMARVDGIERIDAHPRTPEDGFLIEAWGDGV